MDKRAGKRLFWFQGLIYSIVLFLVIYNPPVYSGLSFTTIAVVLSFLYIVFNSRIFNRIINQKSIKHIVVLFGLFLGYYLLEATICFFFSSREEVLDGVLGNLIGFFSFFIVSFGIVVWATKKKISFETMSRLYIMAGLIQSVFVVVCLVSPAAKSFFNNLTMMNSSSEKIARTMEYVSFFRNFGFASTLYDIFGFTMALLGVIALNEALKGNKMFYFISFLLALSAVVNARSAFIIYMVGVIVLLLSRKRGKSVSWIRKTILLLIVLFIIGGLFINHVLNNTSSDHMMWLASGITETIALANGQTEGYYDTLFNDFLVFPNGLSLIFGSGMTPQVAIEHNSDVGYVQNIWMYGIVGSFFLYYFYIKMFKGAINRLGWPNNALMKTMIIMIAVYLIKLTPFGYSQASVVFGPLCLLAAYQGDESDNNLNLAHSASSINPRFLSRN